MTTYADEKLNSAAVGDKLGEVGCVAENVWKIAARGDRGELATMLRVDAWTESIVAGVVDL